MTIYVPIGWKGLSPGTLIEHGITIDDGVVAVPYRGSDGTEVRTKFFGLVASWWSAGDRVHLLGVDRLQWYARREPVIVCEGESDMLAACEAGLQAVGAPGANSWRQQWAEQLVGFEVIVIGDGDQAGRRFGASVKETLANAVVVRLPEGDDLRAVLQRDDTEMLEQCVARARSEGAIEAAVLGCPTLGGAEAMLLGRGGPIDTESEAAPRKMQFVPANTTYETYVLRCAVCGPMPHRWRDRSYDCHGCRS